MQVHWVFEHCDDRVKERARTHWQRELRRIEPLLRHMAGDMPSLRLTLFHRQKTDHSTPPNAWEFRAVLQLPTGTVIARTSGKDVAGVLDNGLEQLVAELRKHRGRLRDARVERTRRERRALQQQLAAAEPLLAADAGEGFRGAFFDLLRPAMRHVYRHARRELRILEAEGHLPRRQVTPSDLVDDVMVRAYERFAERPSDRPLELWLIELLQERLAELQSRPRQTSVYEKLPMESVEVGSQEWWEELLGTREDLWLADLLSDGEDGGLSESLDAEEQQRLVLQTLAGLPQTCRSAFALAVIEGYEPFEVAMIQNRPEEEVQADIDRVRAALRERLQQAVPQPAATGR